MDLKPLANKYSAFDGAVTLWFTPFMTLKASARMEALEQLIPPNKWVNSVTGETRATEPKEWTVEVQLAKEMQREVQSDWQQQRVWTIHHDTFTIVEPLIVDAEFATDKPLTAEVRYLQAYLAGRTGDIAKDWQSFEESLGASAVNQLWQGYTETRDKAMSIDPNSAGGGT